MSTSPNAGFNLQVTGSNNGIWGTNLNSNFSIADGIYGGRVTVSCDGSSNITVSTSQSQNFFQNLTGALTGNILYILPATGGQFFILNNTTGAYTITVVNNAAGTGVVVPQGGSAYVASDPDNTTVYGVIPTALSLSSLSVSGQITSTVTTGTAPFVVSSTTPVANLAIGGNAATATTATTATTTTGNAGTATALATARTIAITGDLAYTSPSFDGSGNVTAAGTLATVNSNVGSYTNASVTVNAKGLVTAASSGSSGFTLGTITSFNSSATYNVASLPAGIKQLNIFFDAVTWSANSPFLIQIGPSGGVASSGYVSGSSAITTGGNGYASSTAGMAMANSASSTFTGAMTFNLIDATNNIWVAVHNMNNATGGGQGTTQGSGVVTLSGALSQITMTTTGGTATWTGGKVNISYQ